ncbi:MAG TPA: NIPSNAP family protein [Alphaproteobacteria bacterium]|nr:NIPSNAP family protein [Alphaproteobacteria bacterium]
MTYEERTYTLKPGSLGSYFKTYEAEGLAVQKAILGNLAGSFQTDFGTLNQVAHIWACESLDEPARRRAKLWQHPTWLSYIPKVLPLVEKMENHLLIPASFSPLK